MSTIAFCNAGPARVVKMVRRAYPALKFKLSGGLISACSRGAATAKVNRQAAVAFIAASWNRIRAHLKAVIEVPGTV